MAENNDLYRKLGVSSKKEDVHDAIKSIDKGIFPGAFCKIVEALDNRDDYCSVFHADGAGTKASLAYMYYRETGDISVFKGIVRDAMVMNLDDFLCIGATGNIFFSNNLGRNSQLIKVDVVGTIIKEYYDYSEKLTTLGLNVKMCGGETADIGDIVKTLVIDASAFTTMKKEDVIDASNIKSNDVIVGLASYGRSSYEDEYNSGIGSNGLTLARHGILSHIYYDKYPECYDRGLDEKFVFFGKYKLTDKVNDLNLTIGKALLSPTRTYAPIIKDILKEFRTEMHGIIHNTGGGQTKILNFGKGIKYNKNNLFRIPKIFELIQRSSEIQWKEMFSVFNMGHRMELLCDESIAPEIMKIAKKYKIDSKIIGYCEKSPIKGKNVLDLKSEIGSFTYY
ncbi:MAG: phosphoribosylformylglycinamidine cyclo-ligase [Promethearchaeota archaeon Loki_b32]|nr:MAG: phosphoribosylformylglycinamidine cyclo-ligase [Candidatus Lokiarchaeota archaeon Loki_b32]